jgi:phosphohistidine phosphatase SixA
MNFLRSFAGLALAAAATACMVNVPQQPGPDFYVMRHLHKAEGSADPGLTAEGQRQAQVLASRFGARPPAVIYVTDTRRARETAAPIAARLQLEPRVYDPRDPAGLVSDLQKDPNPALIIGHSNTVPEIVAALGGARPAPIAETDYGTIYHVSGPRRVVMKMQVNCPLPAGRGPNIPAVCGN